MKLKHRETGDVLDVGFESNYKNGTLIITHDGDYGDEALAEYETLADFLKDWEDA